MTHRGILACGFLLGAVLAGSTLGAAGIPKDREAVEHALNRLAYGPRPGDIERVQQLGLSNWIEQQLHPDAINDSALKARLPEQPSRPDRFTDQMEARRWGRESVQALSSEKVIRAVYSERQLEEQLVDFWFNHFNVFAGKGRTSEWIADYERHAIRPHVLGRFRDLLEATAKSPAMLFYLDNWLSADPAAAERQQELQRQRAALRGTQPPQNPQQRRRGLNENYGRELLELHTLGVDGGYTQQDIIDVARAFTGWTITPANQQAPNRPALPAAPGRRPRQPQQASGAVQEGEFRFVPMLHDTGEKMVLGHKIKAGGGMEDGRQLLNALMQMGMPLYMCQPPTGYDDTADTWVSAGALVARMNIAQRIAGPQQATSIGGPEFQRR